MALAPVTNMLTNVEPLLWTAAFLAFLRVRKQVKLPAFGAFLGIRMVSAFLLLGVSYLPVAALGSHLQYGIYFYTHWITYLAGCIALFFALQALFVNMMAPLPGLSHLGLAGFRWAAVVSLVLSLSSIVTLAASSSIHEHMAAIFTEMAVCFSVLVLCLVAFLGVSIHALGLTYRNIVFGICLGVGLMAASDLMVNALHFSTFANWPVQASEVVIAVALLIWIAFLATPEATRKQESPAVLSRALQWNDLAEELRPNEPSQQAIPQRGFLQNVESVVDRVLAKNSLTG